MFLKEMLKRGKKRDDEMRRRKRRKSTIMAAPHILRNYFFGNIEACHCSGNYDYLILSEEVTQCLPNLWVRIRRSVQ